MKPLGPIIEEHDRGWTERWWFPAGLGGLALAVVFATGTQGVRPNSLQLALALFGVMVGLTDGFGTGQVINYGTLRGPDEREQEANARFYAWKRARRRYAAAVVLSVSASLLLRLFSSDAGQLAALLAPLGMYYLLWAFDVVRSLKEAKVLFPPPLP